MQSSLFSPGSLLRNHPRLFHVSTRYEKCFPPLSLRGVATLLHLHTLHTKVGYAIKLLAHDSICEIAARYLPLTVITSYIFLQSNPLIIEL